MSYESIIQFLKKHKPQIYLVGAFVLIFFIGVGTGKVSDSKSKARSNETSYKNYNTKASPTPTTQTGEIQGVVTPTANSAPTPTTPTQATAVTPLDCKVKGTATSKIYHVSGGTYYDRLKNPICFKTEAEAQVAGFRKSSK